jgi:hypothetical protein
MKSPSLDTTVKFQLSKMRYATCWCRMVQVGHGQSSFRHRKQVHCKWPLNKESQSATEGLKYGWLAEGGATVNQLDLLRFAWRVVLPGVMTQILHQ